MRAFCNRGTFQFRAPAVQIVHRNDARLRPAGFQMQRQTAADKPGTAGDQDAFWDVHACATQAAWISAKYHPSHNGISNPDNATGISARR